MKAPLAVARWLVKQRGFAVIPLDHPDYSRFRTREPEKCGKVPTLAGSPFPWKKYQSTRPRDRDLERWFAKGQQNVGIVAGAISRVVIVDGDSPEALAWMKQHLPPSPTRTKTAKGEHWFYQHPGQPVRNKARIRTGDQTLALDVRADGGYVVAPGSKHASGVVYERQGAWPPVDELPVFDPHWLDLPSRPTPSPPPATQTEGDEQLQRARAYVASVPPAIEGQGGDTHTFRLACKLVRGFALPDAAALEVLRVWNASCQPPWTDRELEAKLDSARKHGDEPYGARLGERGHPPRHGDRSYEQPTGDDAPIASVLERVEQFVRRYVVLTDQQAIIIALWIAHTHAIAAADCTPYLQVTSATAEAGKTRLLEVLELLVAKPWFTGRTTAAALVRKIDADGPTLLLDESDAAFNGEKEYAEALRGILNTGYRRSGRCTLCIGQGANLTFRDFTTFCPKMIAGIGKLPDTVVSRAVRIELRRRTKAEPVEKFREREARGAAVASRTALHAWANDRQLIETLKAARPTMPTGLRDRAEDVLEPLLAVADRAGREWPGRARRAAVALMGSTGDQDINIELLTDINHVFVAHKEGFIKSALLASQLAALDDRPWADWKNGKPITTRAIADRVKPFGVVPTKNEHDDRGYHRDRFEDAWARYLGINPSNCRNPNETGSEVEISNRRDDSTVDGLKMQETPIKTGLFDGSTVQDGGKRDRGSDQDHEEF